MFLIVKFAESQKLYADFQLPGTPSPCIVEGSAVYIRNEMCKIKALLDAYIVGFKSFFSLTQRSIQINKWPSENEEEMFPEVIRHSL